MVDHALIDTGPVPIVGPVHLVVIVRMSELKQSAATGRISAFDELQRPFGNTLCPGRGENPGESLHTKIENLEEFAVPTDTALLQCPIPEHPPWGSACSSMSHIACTTSPAKVQSLRPSRFSRAREFSSPALIRAAVEVILRVT